MNKLTQEEKIFIKKNHQELERFFGRRVNLLKERVFIMNKGDERDHEIDFIKTFTAFLQEIEIVVTNQQYFKDTHI